jgi:hypothetical protein
LAESRQDVVACLLASTTDLGAQAAVLVMGSVPLALLCTCKARHHTRFDRCANEAEIWQRLPREDAAGRVADVGAVEIEPNATYQILQIVLAEASVGARSAADGTVEALANTTQEHLAIQVRRLAMRFENLLKRHTRSLLERGWKTPRSSRWTWSTSNSGCR